MVNLGVEPSVFCDKRIAMALTNKVAQSGLKLIDLEAYYPEQEMVEFDLRDYLFKGLMLKEKEFRQSVKSTDWEALCRGKILCVHCSTDAIIPVWAYMLVAALAQPVANEVFGGTIQQYLETHYDRVISGMNIAAFQGERVILKGCGQKQVPWSAYLSLTARLRDTVHSIMYGEPCSTVPIWKQPIRRAAK